MPNSHNNGVIVGVSDHAGWAVLVTVASDGTIFDRRRITLIDANLPCMPYHHDAQALPLHDAEALIERVRVSAAHHAKLALEAVAKEVSAPIRGIALRKCPPLPPTIAERLRDYRSQNVADWVMYRKAIAEAAESRGGFVYWYDSKKVFDQACEALHVESLDPYFLRARKALGPPWNMDHKLAMVAAIVAATCAD